jgi:hypothetical protein
VLTLRGQRNLPAAGRWAFRSPGAPASASSVRRHPLSPRLAPQRRAPRCAKLRRGAPHPRLDTELAAPGASRRTMLRHGAGPSAGMRVGRTRARPGMAGLTCCTGGKSQLSKRATHRHQCKWQRSRQRNILPGQGAPSPSWGAASTGHTSSLARRRSQIPAADRAIVLLRCCILLLYQALELLARDFEFTCLTWVELRGFEPLTSCMPSTGSTSTAVRLCRSPSQEVRARPVKSAPVAVLSCCTGQPARPGSQ